MRETWTLNPKVLPRIEPGNPLIQRRDVSEYAKMEPKFNLLVMVKQIERVENIELNNNESYFRITLHTQLLNASKSKK